MLTAGAIAATCSARLREPVAEPVLLREFQLVLVLLELLAPVLGLVRVKP